MIKKPRLFVLTLSILFIITLIGCNTQFTNDYSGKPANSNDMMSYSQYRDLFNRMSNYLEIRDYKKLEQSDGVNLIAIDKKFSFNNRSVLTLTGEQTNEETQERIIYTDNDHVVLIIDLIYLDTSLGKDMIFWRSNSTDHLKDDPVIQNIDEAILSFYNILVKISIYSKDEKLNFQTSYDVIDQIVTYLQKYSITKE